MKAAAGPARTSVDPWLDQEVRKRTLEEVEEGKADGPYTEEEAAHEVNGPFVPARRVGVVQGGEVRPIDDFSEFGHNMTSTTHDYADLGGVDRVIAVVKAWMDSVGADGVVRMRLSNGTVLEAPVHPDFVTPESRAPVGRCIDVRRAFKQLPPDPEMEDLLVIFITNPDTKKT